jgi:hypothetical protein
MGWVNNATPGSFTAGKETRYPFYRKLGGPQGRSRQVRKVSPPPGFNPRTVQPIRSRNPMYNVYDIQEQQQSR